MDLELPFLIKSWGFVELDAMQKGKFDTRFFSIIYLLIFVRLDWHINVKKYRVYLISFVLKNHVGNNYSLFDNKQTLDKRCDYPVALGFGIRSEKQERTIKCTSPYTRICTCATARYVCPEIIQRAFNMWKTSYDVTYQFEYPRATRNFSYNDTSVDDVFCAN